MKFLRLIPIVFVLISLPASANDSPTMETVRYVLACMAELGGLKDENLYTCACRHDAIFSRISFSDYDEGVTYERNRDMPGEKGGFFRDNERGEQFYEKLKLVREDANAQCITVKTVNRDQ